MNQSTASVKPRSSRWISSFMGLLIGILLLLALPGASLADNATTAGPATATPGKATKAANAASITVNIPYSGDANGNNTALIEWDEDGGDWNSLLGSQALPHSANPYSFDITGLDNAVTYQIRVTITDPDGGSNLVQTLTGLKPYNMLLHNAVSTDSGKWSGNWGLTDAGSRYGEITCSTCHTTSTGNIKRVKETITAANSPTHNFPGSAVEFLDARDGSAHFGDDSGGRTTSNRICEVCHSATAYHRFNTTGNTGGTNHFNQKDCLRCHKHNQGFKGGGCDGCHGGGTSGTTAGNYWPDSATKTTDSAETPNDAGAHAAHMSALAQKVYGETIAQLLSNTGDTSDNKQKALCAYCHRDPGTDADHGAGDDAEVTQFKRIWDGAVDSDPAGTFHYNYTDLNTATCSNIDCHNSVDTTAAFAWYSGATGACVLCHAGDATGATSGSHQAHRGAPNEEYFYTFACDNCHEPAMTWSATDAGVKPGSGHLDGVKTVGISDGFAYDPGTLSCGTNRCHNDGKGAAPLISGYQWGTPLGGCRHCHDDLPSSFAHNAHWDTDENTVGASRLTCDRCHSQATAPSYHMDRQVTLLAAMNYGRDGYTAEQLTSVGGTNDFGRCSTTSCHQDGKGTIAPTPLWTETASATVGNTCALCHAAKPTTGSHNQHVVTGTTAYGQTGNQSTQTTYDFMCGECHGNSLAAHIDEEFSFGAVGWQSVDKTCNASDCHSDGAATPVHKPSPVWGVGFSGDPCAACHGNSPDNEVHHEHEVGFHYDAVYSGFKDFLPVRDSDPRPEGLTGDLSQLRGHGGRLLDGTPSSTTLTCNVCHYDTVKGSYNANNTTCKGCHTAHANPTEEQKGVGNAALTIHDKRKHVNGERDIRFFDQKVRSKAQLRDDLADVPELGNNWLRKNGYKAADGSSYDEQPDVLYNMATWNNEDKTCLVSCHLWEAGRVDKVPAKWNGGAIMCIDCHSRLPK